MRVQIPGALHEAIKLLALLPVSALAPIEQLLPLARTIRRGRPRRIKCAGASEIVMAHLLGDRVSPCDAAELFQQWQNRSLELAMQILALRRPGRRWRPRIRVDGYENLAAALRRGAGALLWVSDFVYRPVIVPLAIRQAGFRSPVHLSRPEHGFSVSPFGVRFLNPVWVSVENRFLTERVVIKNNDASAALNTLRNRLARNEIVSITVAETGRRTLDAKFLHGTLRVASGPIHLARTSGAPLLPIFAVRNPQGIYEVSIGRALPVDDVADPPYATTVLAYAAMLEPFVRKYPDQWNGWIALGRLVENAPAFTASFECASALAQDLERLGLPPRIPLPAVLGDVG
jgi:lauroyl/myristoyl acyltransferase